MKNTFLLFLFLVALNSFSFGQEIIIGTDLTSPSLEPNNFNVENGSYVFKAENSVTLTGCFHVKATDNGCSDNFFLATIDIPNSYAELKKELDGAYYTTIANLLKFKYVEKYVEGVLDYQIYNYRREPLINSDLACDDPDYLLIKNVGSNFFTIDLSKINGMIRTTELESYYTLEVVNDKKEKFLLRFKYSSIN